MSFKNPYEFQAATLSSQLADPTVNTFEHSVNTPRLWALLPPAKNVKTILDFGCGPGNFTTQLAEKYPDAHIMAVDASAEILPADREQDNISFRQWNGFVPKRRADREALQDELGDFDLVIAKMSLHYLAEQLSFLQRWQYLLHANSNLVFSVPHPERSGLKVSRGITQTPSYRGIPYETQIGNTDVTASMVHRSTAEWIATVRRFANAEYHRTIIDEPGEGGTKKRLNVLLCPPKTNPVPIVDNLRALTGKIPLSFKERLAGKWGVNTFLRVQNMEMVATTNGCTGLLYKNGYLLNSQVEAEYFPL